MPATTTTLVAQRLRCTYQNCTPLAGTSAVQSPNNATSTPPSIYQSNATAFFHPSAPVASSDPARMRETTAPARWYWSPLEHQKIVLREATTITAIIYIPMNCCTIPRKKTTQQHPPAPHKSYIYTYIQRGNMAAFYGVKNLGTLASKRNNATRSDTTIHDELLLLAVHTIFPTSGAPPTRCKYDNNNIVHDNGRRSFYLVPTSACPRPTPPKSQRSIDRVHVPTRNPDTPIYDTGIDNTNT